jgi:hypothetical protein
VALRRPFGRRGRHPRALSLHVGTPKSGTTYLQALLAGSRRELGTRGVVYPGAGYMPKRGLNQQAAMYGVAGPEVRWISAEVRSNGERLMTKIAAELNRHRGRALVSAEALASFAPQQARAVVDALGYSPDQVEVVITARDLGRLLTSVWQENVKNGATMGMAAYLDSVAELRTHPDNSFWNAYRLPDLVDRWAAVVGMERVCLVTAPRPAERDQLWPRFCRAMRVEGLPLPPQSPARVLSNASLSASQVELLRRMNGLLDVEENTHDARQRLRARLLAAWMSAPPAGAGAAPVELEADRLPTVRGWSELDVAALGERVAAGLRLEGDLTELIPGSNGSNGSNGLGGSNGSNGASGSPAGPSLEDTARDVLALLRSAAAQTPQSAGRA